MNRKDFLRRAPANLPPVARDELRMRNEIAGHLMGRYKFFPPEAAMGLDLQAMGGVEPGDPVKVAGAPFPVRCCMVSGVFLIRPAGLCATCQVRHLWRPYRWKIRFPYSDWAQLNPQKLDALVYQVRVQCVHWCIENHHAVATMKRPRH